MGIEWFDVTPKEETYIPKICGYPYIRRHEVPIFSRFLCDWEIGRPGRGDEMGGQTHRAQSGWGKEKWLGMRMMPTS